MENTKVSKCCKASMRYIDDFLCCAQCGKSTEPENTKEESWSEELEDLINDIRSNASVDSRYIHTFVRFLLSKEKARIREVVEKIENMLKIYPAIYDTEKSMKEGAVKVLEDIKEILK